MTPSYRSNSSPSLRSGKARPVVAITIGDPFGVGPEVVLKAVGFLGGLARKGRAQADFIIVGDSSVLSAASRLPATPAALPRNVSIVDPYIIAPSEVKFGCQSKLSGEASLAYLDLALRLIKEKKADCLVNAPLSKEAVSSAFPRINFIGHTEYIAGRFKVKDFAMMLLGGPLKVTLVTRHIPVRAVPKSVTKKEIIKSIKLSHEALVDYFGIAEPRIGVASLNPHGGEGGKIGREEIEVIRPAVNEAKRRFKNIIGPVSSESLFYLAYRGKLDCVVAMYHDQGLTPLKMIARDNSINVTLGLPFVRTSPGHGTAFDIAGKGIADPGPLIESVKLAVGIFKKKKGRT